jgi:hypothetical protein
LISGGNARSASFGLIASFGMRFISTLRQGSARARHSCGARAK